MLDATTVTVVTTASRSVRYYSEIIVHTRPIFESRILKPEGKLNISIACQNISIKIFIRF